MKMRNMVMLLAALMLTSAMVVACAEDSNSGTTNNTTNKPAAGSLFGDSKGGSGGTNGVSSKGGAASVFAGSTKSSSGSTTTTVERGTTDASSCTTACEKIIACYGGFEDAEQADCEMGCAESAVSDELSCILSAEQGTEMDAACTTMFDTCFGYDSTELDEIDVEDGELATDAQCSEACNALGAACGELFGDLEQADIDACVSECAGVAPVGEVLCLSASAASGCEYALEACFGYEDTEFEEFEDEFEDVDTSGSTSGDTSGSTSGDTSGSTSGDTSGTTTGVSDAECAQFCSKVMECDPTVAMEECEAGCAFVTSEIVACALESTCEDAETVCVSQ